MELTEHILLYARQLHAPRSVIADILVPGGTPLVVVDRVQQRPAKGSLVPRMVELAVEVSQIVSQDANGSVEQ